MTGINNNKVNKIKPTEKIISSQNRYFETDLPESWKIVKLRDVAEFINGRAFKPSEWGNKGLPIIRIQNLTESSSVINHYEGIYDKKYYVDNGDILLSWSATLDIFKWKKGPALLNQHIFKVKPKKDILSDDYFLYYLKTILQKLKDKTHGSGMKHITKPELLKQKMILPPLPTQKKIVTVLEKAEKLRDWRKESDALTDEFLKSVFLDMFGDPVKNSKGWGKRKLKGFGKIKTGNTPSRKKPEYYGNYIEWIKSDNINTPYTYLTKSDEMLSETGSMLGRIAPNDSVLVTCIAGSLSCIGNVAITDRVVAFNQQINAIIPNEEVNELFLYHLILNTKQYIQNHSTQSMKGMLSKGVFESIPFIFPPTDLQNKFGSMAKEFERLREHQKQSKEHIEELFNALMQKAFKGELALN